MDRLQSVVGFNKAGLYSPSRHQSDRFTASYAGDPQDPVLGTVLGQPGTDLFHRVVFTGSVSGVGDEVLVTAVPGWLLGNKVIRLATNAGSQTAPKYADPNQKWETVQALTLAESFVAGYTRDPETGDIHSEITAKPKWQEGAEVTLRHSATPRPMFKTFVYTVNRETNDVQSVWVAKGLFPSSEHLPPTYNTFAQGGEKKIDGTACFGDLPTAQGLAALLGPGFDQHSEVLDLAQSLQDWEPRMSERFIGGETVMADVHVGTIGDGMKALFDVYTTVSYVKPEEVLCTTVGRDGLGDDPTTLTLNVQEV